MNSARTLARLYDAHESRHQGIHARRAWPWVIGAVIAAAVVARLTWGGRALALAGWGAVWLGVSLGLIYQVERLPWVWPNVVRAVLFVLVNAGLLLVAARPARWACRLQRYPVIGVGMVPGWLLVSYPVNTQVEAYLAVIVVGLAVVFRYLAATRKSPTLQRDDPLVSYLGPALFALSLLLLAPVGTRPSDVCPSFFSQRSGFATLLVASLVALGVLAIVRPLFLPSMHAPVAPRGYASNVKLAASHRGWLLVAAVVATVASLALRHEPLHGWGRLLLVSAVAGLVTSLWCGRLQQALVLALLSYAWVSRDFEWLFVAPSLVVADAIGSLMARESALNVHWAMPRRLVCVVYLFALTMLLRIGLAGGIQLTNLDVSVGTFGDIAVPRWISGICMVFKFWVVEFVLLALFLRHFPGVAVRAQLRGLATAQLVRVVALLLMLFACGDSYWTAFRVVADLPLAMVGLLNLVVISAVLRGTLAPRHAAQS